MEKETCGISIISEYIDSFSDIEKLKTFAKFAIAKNIESINNLESQNISLRSNRNCANFSYLTETYVDRTLTVICKKSKTCPCDYWEFRKPASNL